MERSNGILTSMLIIVLFIVISYLLTFLHILKSSILHPSLSSASLKASPIFRPVHSRMSSHLFLCMHLALCPCTVPCKIVLASPFDFTTCPYHFSLRFFHCGQDVIKRPDGLLNLFSYFLIGDVFLRDAEESAKASHLCGLYPLF